MNYPALIFVLLFLLLGMILTVGGNYLRKDARRIYNKIDEFRQAARGSNHLGNLEQIRKELLAYAKKECWHRHLWMDALNAVAFIDGKLSEIRNENEKKFAK